MNSDARRRAKWRRLCSTSLPVIQIQAEVHYLQATASIYSTSKIAHYKKYGCNAGL